MSASSELKQKPEPPSGRGSNGTTQPDTKAYASPGMIAAYRDGLSLGVIAELWVSISRGSVHLRLRNSGVAMRSIAEAVKSAPSTATINHYRKIAMEELTQVLPPWAAVARNYATPGMIAAYNNGLSIRRIAELWDLRLSATHRRLTNSRVAMRSTGHDGRQPPAVIVDYFREVAARELAEATETEARSLASAVEVAVDKQKAPAAQPE